MSALVTPEKSFIYDYAISVRDSLGLYERELHAVEREITNAEPNVAQELMQREQYAFDAMFSSHLEVLEGHATGLDARQRAEEGRILRAVCKSFIEQAPIVHRTNIKPRGYQGDSEMMRMLYANDWRGGTLLGKLLHKHCVSTPAAEAVRNRRPLIAEEARYRIVRHHGYECFSMLSVACGPANEVADIFRSATDFQELRVTFLDQDAEAIEEARQNLRQTEMRFGAKAQARYEQRSIAALLRPTPLRADLGKFDFIYSMGLYDYLDDKTARALTHALFEMLKPNGTLLIGNYAKTHERNVLLMEYWCDWPLIYRTAQALESFALNTGAREASVGFESSGSQMFLRMRKAKHELSTRSGISNYGT